MGFSFSGLGHAPGVGLGLGGTRGVVVGGGGGGGQKFIFHEIQPNLICLITHMNGTCNNTFCYLLPLGPLGGVKRPNIIKFH